MVAVDGSVRWFDGFKKGGFASVWGDKSHILNRQKISNLEPLSYIQELEGILLAIQTAVSHNIDFILILVDNKASLETAKLIISEPRREDYLVLSNNNVDIAKFLNKIGNLSKDKNIKLLHLHSHTGIPGVFTRMNSLADSVANEILDVTYEFKQSIQV